ncbi:MAG: hypothetical protein A3F46_03905 [Legionellales bacterium RIFCSPHIGHO2_12_FULL_42_9]|nr:MAG: hypothetical protein A3F46_03905 [Legionellales bacterium RIFCSPHIGHO2_12_FULL_42_9]
MAIVLMGICLVFLFMNKMPAYKIAFVIGLTSFVAPMLIYKLGGFAKHRQGILKINQYIQFKDIFPNRKNKV